MREGGPLDEQEGPSLRHPEVSAQLFIRVDGFDAVAPAQHRYCVVALQDVIDRLLLEVVLLEELRAEDGQPRPVERDRLFVGEAQTVDPDDGASLRHLEGGRGGRDGRFRCMVGNPGRGLQAGLGHVLHEVGQPDEALRHALVLDERAQPLPPVDQAFVFERLKPGS